MFKKTSMLFFFLLCVSFGFGQTKEIDTAKIIDLIEKSEAIEFSEPQKAIKLYKEAYDLSLKSNYDEGAFKATLYTALVHSNMAQYDSAMYYYDKSTVINQKIDSELNEVRIILNRANIFMFRGEFEKSIESHLNGIKILERKKDSVRLSGAYANLSAVYQQLDDFDKQLEFQKKSLHITPAKEIVSLGLTHCDMILPYLMKKKFNQALFHMKKADST